MLKDKKGLHLVGEEIVFYILNAVFFIVMLVFIFNSVNGRPIYEQAYAKQIAFLIDQAKPGTNITLDVSDICKEYKIPLIKLDSSIKDVDGKKYRKPLLDAFKILETTENGLVTRQVAVKFGTLGSYGMPYFNNVKVEFDGIVDGKEGNELLPEVEQAIKENKKIEEIWGKKKYCSQLKIKILEK